MHMKDVIEVFTSRKTLKAAESAVHLKLHGEILCTFANYLPHP